MKYANKCYGNKIREAYGMINEVYSLFSEHLVPTPILDQSGPNFHLLFAKLQMRCTLYKTILAKNHPKREKQREILIN